MFSHFLVLCQLHVPCNLPLNYKSSQSSSLPSSEWNPIFSPLGYELNDTSHKCLGKEKDGFCKSFLSCVLKNNFIGWRCWPWDSGDSCEVQKNGQYPQARMNCSTKIFSLTKDPLWWFWIASLLLQSETGPMYLSWSIRFKEASNKVSWLLEVSSDKEDKQHYVELKKGISSRKANILKAWIRKGKDK